MIARLYPRRPKDLQSVRYDEAERFFLLNLFLINFKVMEKEEDGDKEGDRESRREKRER